VVVDGQVRSKTMWKENFKRDCDYWEKTELVNRDGLEEERFENNRGYKSKLVRKFDTPNKVPFIEFLTTDDGCGTKTEECRDLQH